MLDPWAVSCESATTLAAHFDPLSKSYVRCFIKSVLFSKSMARTQTGPWCTCGSGPLLRVSGGLVHIRAKSFESGSKCAAKSLLYSCTGTHVAARAKLQAVPLGVCKAGDQPRGCHSVCHLACAWELRALPNKEAKIAAVPAELYFPRYPSQ